MAQHLFRAKMKASFPKAEVPWGSEWHERGESMPFATATLNMKGSDEEVRRKARPKKVRNEKENETLREKDTDTDGRNSENTSTRNQQSMDKTQENREVITVNLVEEPDVTGTGASMVSEENRNRRREESKVQDKQVTNGRDLLATRETLISTAPTTTNATTISPIMSTDNGSGNTMHSFFGRR